MGVEVTNVWGGAGGEERVKKRGGEWQGKDSTRNARDAADGELAHVANFGLAVV